MHDGRLPEHRFLNLFSKYDLSSLIFIQRTPCDSKSLDNILCDALLFSWSFQIVETDCNILLRNLIRIPYFHPYDVFDVKTCPPQTLAL